MYKGVECQSLEVDNNEEDIYFCLNKIENVQLNNSNIHFVECLHYKFCNNLSYFKGCSIFCKDYIYENNSIIKKQFENTYNLILPYNFNLIYNDKLNKFMVII
jgi:hypothetical protein